MLSTSGEGNRAVTLALPDDQPLSDTDLVLHDLQEGTSRPITSHGRRLHSVALSRDGSVLVTGDKDGIVRVGRVDSDQAHLLVGPEVMIWSVAVSPDGRWIAAGGTDGSIRLWPMPDLSATPFQALPREELLSRLRSLTNLRAVPDPRAPGGYKIDIGPFPGWADVPEW